jgi:hypothetical protein
MRWVLVSILSLRALAAAGTAAETARAIRENTFDRNECYRVRDLTVIRHDIRVYLTDGFLIFSKPVAGRRLAAVFSAEVEGGDGEIIVIPPNRGERRSLASYIESPNLDEHFRAALFLGSDLYDEVTSQMKANPANRRVAEMGPVLDDTWTPVLRNLSTSYETRLTLDVLDAAGPGQSLFAGLFSGIKLANFDVVYDPRGSERVSVGQVANRNNRTYFDVWTSFEPRNQPPRTAPVFGSEATLSDYRIEATMEPNLNMAAVTRVKVKPLIDGLRVLPLDIARDMRVESALVDGKPTEILQREALRENLGRGGNEMFLVIPPEPLSAARTYEFEFRHSGKVIHDAGDRVYYVLARGNWYPANGLRYATYDLKFRYPRDLDLVSAGEVVEDSTDGDWRTTRRRTTVPIRVAGFNLGSYHHVRVTRGGFVVEVYANRSLEKALQPKPRETIVLPPPAFPRARRNVEQPHLPQAEPPPSPAGRLQMLAADVGSALEFMAAKFGPPALPFLTVSPIPSAFGQGFPGMVYLSTLSYLKVNTPSTPRLDARQEFFFGEILEAHETAHQWWGNLVNAAGYHDYWLMEALANYSALLYLEKHKGVRSMEQVLEQYRDDLLAHNESGQMIDSAGPIVLGPRLESSLEPRAWRAITYGKGSWILHMLRRMMGDDRFFAMLAEMRRRYEFKEIGTDQFRLLAARYLPPKSDDPKLEAFFEQWVYATGVPHLKLTWSVKGKAPALKLVGTVSQSEVSDDTNVLVPVEVSFGRGKSIVHWVRTSSEPVAFTVPLKQAPLKVSLDPHLSVLRRP